MKITEVKVWLVEGVKYNWTKLYRDLSWIGPYGASMCAISGLDMALLDRKAKVLGVPMYQLLGGVDLTEEELDKHPGIRGLHERDHFHV